MVRLIIAIDTKGGIADKNGIPWSLKSDRQHYKNKTTSGMILRGYKTYLDDDRPSHNRTTYVATTKKEKLRDTFKRVGDARDFLKSTKEDVWIIGGANLISETLDLIDELYITQLLDDFNCTKFMPQYKHKFKMVSQSSIHNENKINFRYQVWRRIPS